MNEPKKFIFMLLLITGILLGEANGITVSLNGGNGPYSVASHTTYNCGQDTSIIDHANIAFNDGLSLTRSSIGKSKTGKGDFEDGHSASNLEGDYVSVGIDIDKASSWSYSYFVSPGDGGGYSSDHVAASQSLTVKNADLIHGHAWAGNAEGDYADTCTYIRTGSLIGYKHSALATIGSAESETSWSSASGREIWSSPYAFNDEGDQANVRADIWQGSVGGYASTAIATLSNAESYQKANTITGKAIDSITPGISLTASSDNRELDKSELKLVADSGSITKYSDYVNTMKSSTFGSQSMNLLSGNSINFNTLSNNVRGDSSKIESNIVKPKNLYVDGIAKVSNSDDGENHRTGTDANFMGTASLVSSDSYAYYLGEGAEAHGAWEVYGSGDLNLGAKTVKSAVADLELTTSSDKAEASTKSTDMSGSVRSALMVYAQERASVGDVKKFQAHLYSHAYFNGYNQEYVSTASTGVTGTKIDAGLNRWDESANSWDIVRINRDPTNWVFRGTDISTWLGPQDGFWEVPAIATKDKPSQKDCVPWGVEMMYGKKSLTKTSGGRGVDVGIIDSGVDMLHPDLVFRVEEFSNDESPREYGYEKDGVLNTYLAYDSAHGTHIAGTIAANGGFDGKGVWGMAPEADLHIYKLGFGDGELARGVKRLTDLGIDIISISQGTAQDAELSEAINYAHDNGVIVVAAAGNGIPDDKEIIYPAAYPNVVAVGAVNEKKNAVWWTSPGYNIKDGEIAERDVMFAAPGLNIFSTTPIRNDGTSHIVFGTDYNFKPRYDTKDGTSMATPHISGLAARLMSINRLDGLGSDDIIDIMQVQATKNDIKNVDLNAGDPVIGHYNELQDCVGMAGAPGNYYKYLSQLIRKEALNDPNFLIGEDCITGLGIPIYNL